ncbi:MAG: hypothetical protein LKF79_08035 [Solobacterium sp.]|nr:hypothetical protein [Solobacterium sp.]MCH4223153.1 hypothetical protein [Solobacterium sp.]MCH4266576.1 hypothetical protein [Solobacterium sp.]
MKKQKPQQDNQTERIVTENDNIDWDDVHRYMAMPPEELDRLLEENLRQVDIKVAEIMRKEEEEKARKEAETKSPAGK